MFGIFHPLIALLHGLFFQISVGDAKLLRFCVILLLDGQALVGIVLVEGGGHDVVLLVGDAFLLQHQAVGVLHRPVLEFLFPEVVFTQLVQVFNKLLFFLQDFLHLLVG